MPKVQKPTRAYEELLERAAVAYERHAQDETNDYFLGAARANAFAAEIIAEIFGLGRDVYADLADRGVVIT